MFVDFRQQKLPSELNVRQDIFLPGRSQLALTAFFTRFQGKEGRKECFEKVLPV